MQRACRRFCRTRFLLWQIALSVCLLPAFFCRSAAAQSNPQVPQGGSNTFPATSTQNTTGGLCAILNPAGVVVASFSSYTGGSANGWTVSATAQVIGQIPMGPSIYGPLIYTVTAPASAAPGNGYRVRSNSWMYPAGLADFDVVAPPAPGVPSVPLNLSAYSGDAKVLLCWAGSLGATSYKVKRATTSGGPYAIVASPTGVTYTDSAITNGATYYYVVSAVNASGESADSNQATAPPYLPSAPTFSNVLETSVTVTAPALTTNATSLTLQKKQASEPDTAYVTVASGLAGGAATAVTGLTLGVTYSFRYLAVGGGGSTAGKAADVTTKPPTPAAPAAPVLSNVTSNALSATLPALPANATSLTLQKKEPYNPEGAFQAVATGQPAGAVVTVSGLEANKQYDFRCLAVNVGGSTAGAIAQVTTAPPPPGAPTFSAVTRESVTVTAPPMPSPSGPFSLWRPYTLTLQRKLTGAPDSSYVNVVTDLPVRDSAYSYYYVTYRAVTEVIPLQSGTSYDFRYVAVGDGGVINGVAATMSTSLQISWSAGGAIACGGIRWPQPGSNPTLALGARGRLSAFLATDWDAYSLSANGVPAQNRSYSDPCSYSWSATGGSFENGISSGQSVVWIAPANAGTYTLRLTVDDQNAQNKPAADAGSRDDAARGYNDTPLTFQVSVTVQ